jgi:hypothetical protein
MPRFYIHPETYGNMLNVHQTLMIGGGRTVTRYGSKSHSLLQTFQKTGWKQSVLQKQFKSLTDKMLQNNDEQDTERVRVFADIWFEELGFDTSIAKTLLNMGLTTRAANSADQAISPLLYTCYSHKQNIQIAIQYLLGYYKQLTPQNGTYFYKPELRDQWIPYTTINGDTIPVMNYSKSCTITQKDELESLLHSTFSKANHMLFYHTSSWSSCKSIMREINHLSGMPCLDFGVLPSFYMTNVLQHALEWGSVRSANFSNEVGTVIFSIPTILPSKLRYKHLQGEEWKSVMIQSRICNTIDIPEDQNIPQVQGYDFIFGDILKNSISIKKGKTTLPIPHDPPKKQLASKTNRGDIFLQNCIVGCIFFNKNE